MSGEAPRDGGLFVRIFLIAATLTAATALIVGLERTSPVVAEEPPATTPGVLAAADVPIPGEADLFRSRYRVLAIAPADDRRRSAHPRTLKTYRALRAYPGAPPTIPHGFTADEFRTGACKTCHERGGYSPRFGAYVPLTPHPEMTACLQCHVGDDALTGVTLPTLDPNARCRQCHVTPGQRAAMPVIDWQPGSWPALAARVADRGPAPIPHDLQFRGNCIACHTGPAAVAELRTTHPERLNCRQCHVPIDADAAPFVRPPARDGADPGGAS